MIPLQCCKSCNIEISSSLKDLRGTLTLFWGTTITNQSVTWINSILLTSSYSVLKLWTKDSLPLTGPYLSLLAVWLWWAVLKPLVQGCLVWRTPSVPRILFLQFLYKLLKSHANTCLVTIPPLFFLGYMQVFKLFFIQSFKNFGRTGMTRAAKIHYLFILFFFDVKTKNYIINLVMPSPNCQGNQTGSQTLTLIHPLNKSKNFPDTNFEKCVNSITFTAQLN